MRRVWLILFGFLAIVSTTALALALVFWSSAYESSSDQLNWSTLYIKYGKLTFLYSSDDWPPGGFLAPGASNYSKASEGWIHNWVVDIPGVTATIPPPTPPPFDPLSSQIWRPGAVPNKMQVNAALAIDLDHRWFFTNFHDDPWQIVLHVNLFALTVVTGILPIVFLIRVFFRSRRMARENVCRKCSYDLTGNVTGVCPECGSPIAAGKV